ncbi:MAG: glycosyltransferase family 4 protein [Vicinamibacteria bacterium]
MHLLYLHGGRLDHVVGTGKVKYLEPLNPGRLFNTVHMVSVNTRSASDREHGEGDFRFTEIGLGGGVTGRVGRLLALWRALTRIGNGNRPDLVLADDANLLGAAARYVARRCRVPYAVCVYYDNDLHYRLTGCPALAFLRTRLLERILERQVFGGAIGVFAMTRGYYEYGMRNGAPRDRAFLGTWSVDDIFYENPGGPHPESRELLFVGRLHPLKYIDDVLRALAKLPARLRLDVAGEGEDRSRLEAMVSRLGLAQRVRFLGRVPREELTARMQGAQSLIVTQGFSAAVECLLSGRPVVAYEHECNTEVVRNGETGLTVPFRDVDGLAKAIAQLDVDRGLAERLGRVGRQRMIEECDIQQSIEHRRRFLEKCLNGNDQSVVPSCIG